MSPAQQFATRVTCVNDRGCGYETVETPPPQNHPHCAKCGGPVRLETKEVPPGTVGWSTDTPLSPASQLAQVIRENPRGVESQWPDNAGAGAPVVGKPIEVDAAAFNLSSFTDAQLFAELQRRGAAAQDDGSLAQAAGVDHDATKDDGMDLGTDSAPVDDGTPPL